MRHSILVALLALLSACSPPSAPPSEAQPSSPSSAPSSAPDSSPPAAGEARIGDSTQALAERVLSAHKAGEPDREAAIELCRRVRDRARQAAAAQGDQRASHILELGKAVHALQPPSSFPPKLKAMLPYYQNALAPILVRVCELEHSSEADRAAALRSAEERRLAALKDIQRDAGLPQASADANGAAALVKALLSLQRTFKANWGKPGVAQFFMQLEKGRLRPGTHAELRAMLDEQLAEPCALLLEATRASSFQLDLSDAKRREVHYVPGFRQAVRALHCRALIAAEAGKRAQAIPLVVAAYRIIRVAMTHATDTTAVQWVRWSLLSARHALEAVTRGGPLPAAAREQIERDLGFDVGREVARSFRIGASHLNINNPIRLIGVPKDLLQTAWLEEQLRALSHVRKQCDAIALASTGGGLRLLDQLGSGAGFFRRRTDHYKVFGALHVQLVLCEQRMSQAALALIARRDAGQALPGDLELPIDPFTGRRLSYRNGALSCRGPEHAGPLTFRLGK